jgi:hypothetical protein
MLKQSPFSISSADSSRFGLVVIRGTVTEHDPVDAVLTAIHESTADISIISCPAGCTTHPRELMESGYLPIHADTLVYYGCSLTDALPAPIELHGVESSAARADEINSIGEIARLCFSDYRSHYLANPRLDPQLVVDGYVEWAQKYLANNEQTRDTWAVRVDGRVCGFATCATTPDRSSVEIVLNGVAPSHMGRGLYGHLLNTMIRHYSGQGFQSLQISTQIWNYVVQRAWTRAGLTLQRAFDTYHVNATPPSIGA